ncbi:MAG: MATE family efflux transporter, partial [Oscillospiraceae bacterium]|nr:MATE family efflux transporter [Oscillospiraceae bacterium]
GKTYVSVDPRLFSLKKPIVLGVFGVGLPAAIQNLLNVTSMTIFNNFAAVFGTDALAAMGIVKKIDMIPMNVTMGLSQGIMPLVSYNYSSGNIKRAKGAVLLTGKIGAAFTLAVTALFFFGAGGIMGLFTKTPVVAEYGIRFLRGMCIGLTFLCLDFLAVGVFQAVGLGHYSLLFAFARKIVLEIPFIYLLNYLFPLYGLPYAQTVTEIIMAVLAISSLVYLFRKWEKKAAGSAAQSGE